MKRGKTKGKSGWKNLYEHVEDFGCSLMIFPAINRCYKNSIIGTKPRIEVIENQEKDVRSENNSIGGETEKIYKKFNSIF